MNSSRSSSRGRIQLTVDQSADNYQATAMALQKKAQLSRVSSKKSIIEIARSQNSSCSSMKRLDSFSSQPFYPQQMQTSAPNSFNIPKVSRNAKTISNTMSTFELPPKQKLQFSFAQNIRNGSVPCSLQVFKKISPPPSVQTIKPFTSFNSIRPVSVLNQPKQTLARSEHRYSPVQSIAQPIVLTNQIRKQAIVSPNEQPKRPLSARPIQALGAMPLSNLANSSLKPVDFTSLNQKVCLQASFNPILTNQRQYVQPLIKKQAEINTQPTIPQRTSILQNTLPHHFRQDYSSHQKQPVLKSAAMLFPVNQLHQKAYVPQSIPGLQNLTNPQASRPIQPNFPVPIEVAAVIPKRQQPKPLTHTLTFPEQNFQKQKQQLKMDTFYLNTEVEKLQQSHLFPSPAKNEPSKGSLPLKKEIQEWKPLTQQDYLSYGLKQQSVQLRKSELSSMVPVHSQSLFRVDQTPAELMEKFNEKQRLQTKKPQQNFQRQIARVAKATKNSNTQLDRFMAPKFGEPYEQKYFELGLSKEDSKDTTRASNFKQEWSPYEHISGIAGKSGRQRQLKKQNKSKGTRPLFKESVNMKTVQAVQSITLEAKQPRRADSKRRAVLGDFEKVQFQSPIYSGMY